MLNAAKERCLCALCLLTRCVDAAHLNSTGYMTCRPTLWIHEGPLLSSHQVTCHTLWKHTNKQRSLSAVNNKEDKEVTGDTEFSCLSHSSTAFRTLSLPWIKEFLAKLSTNRTTRTSSLLYPHTQHQLPSGVRVESLTLFTLHVQLYSNPSHKLNHKIRW